MKKEKTEVAQSDSPHKQPKLGYFVVSTLLGGIFGFITSIFFYNQIILYFIPFLFTGEITFFNIFLIVIFAPFGEEISKILPIVFLEQEESQTFPPLGWMYLGLGSGLGFTLLENALYGMEFINQFTFSTGMILLLVRFLLPLHLLSTPIAAYGIGAWKDSQNKKWIAFLLLAMILHGAHNFLAVYLSV